MDSKEAGIGQVKKVQGVLIQEYESYLLMIVYGENYETVAYRFPLDALTLAISEPLVAVVDN